MIKVASMVNNTIFALFLTKNMLYPIKANRGVKNELSGSINRSIGHF